MRGGERLKSPQQYVEWCNLEHMPLIQLHSLTNLSPPLISHDKISVPKCRYFIVTASPRGKPRTQKTLATTIQRSVLLRGLWDANLATHRSPVRSTLGSLSEGAAEQSEAEGVYPVVNVGVLRYTNDTLSVSPFGLPAFNRCMIATGNHNFERPAALCNTLSGEPRRLRRSGRQIGDPYGRIRLSRCSHICNACNRPA